MSRKARTSNLPSSPIAAQAIRAESSRRLTEESLAVRDAWQRLLGRPMPEGMRPSLAAECLAYERQVREERGLTAAAERALDALLESVPTRRPRRMKPGTRLIRAWQGRTHTVTVGDPGFLYKGRTYRSLSVIAREITGTAWSGPAFFGLNTAEKSHGRR